MDSKRSTALIPAKPAVGCSCPHRTHAYVWHIQALSLPGHTESGLLVLSKTSLKPPEVAVSFSSLEEVWAVLDAQGKWIGFCNRLEMTTKKKIVEQAAGTVLPFYGSKTRLTVDAFIVSFADVASVKDYTLPLPVANVATLPVKHVPRPHSMKPPTPTGCATLYRYHQTEPVSIQQLDQWIDQRVALLNAIARMRRDVDDEALIAAWIESFLDMAPDLRVADTTADLASYHGLRLFMAHSTNDAIRQLWWLSAEDELLQFRLRHQVTPEIVWQLANEEYTWLECISLKEAQMALLPSDATLCGLIQKSHLAGLGMSSTHDAKQADFYVQHNLAQHTAWHIDEESFTPPLVEALKRCGTKEIQQAWCDRQTQPCKPVQVKPLSRRMKDPTSTLDNKTSTRVLDQPFVARVPFEKATCLFRRDLPTPVVHNGWVYVTSEDVIRLCLADVRRYAETFVQTGLWDPLPSNLQTLMDKVLLTIDVERGIRLRDGTLRFANTGADKKIARADLPDIEELHSVIPACMRKFYKNIRKKRGLKYEHRNRYMTQLAHLGYTEADIVRHFEPTYQAEEVDWKVIKSSIAKLTADPRAAACEKLQQKGLCPYTKRAAPALARAMCGNELVTCGAVSTARDIRHPEQYVRVKLDQRKRQRPAIKMETDHDVVMKKEPETSS